MSSINLKNISCLDVDTDAIVNAANGNMIHGGGIARAIRLKAGKELDDACHIFPLPVEDGQNIITPAFGIKNAKIIIHAVGPDFNKTPDAFDKLYDSYYNSLVSLKKMGFHKIAFPLISSGIFAGDINEPVKLSTRECIKSYNTFIKDNPNYEIEVILCAYTKEEYDEALDEFNNSVI